MGEILHTLDTTSRRPLTSLSMEGHQDIDLYGHLQSHTYDALSEIHRRQTGRHFQFKPQAMIVEGDNITLSEYEEMTAAVQRINTDPRALYSPPPPTYVVGDVGLLMGDGGRADSGVFADKVMTGKKMGDCAATSLAFALNRGMPDNGLSYMYAHKLLSQYDKVHGDADWGQNLKSVTLAYQDAGFEFDVLDGRLSARGLREYRQNADRGMIVCWTRHAYALRSDNVIMDSWRSTLNSNGHLKVMNLRALFHETAQTDAIRAKLGVAYAETYGLICPAYADYVTIEEVDGADAASAQAREQSTEAQATDYATLWHDTFAAL